jgi:PAS domain S-box-containing protein
MFGTESFPADLSPSSHSGEYGVLYRFWREERPKRFEFLSTNGEDLLEMTADELLAAMADRTFPIFGVDSQAFYQCLGNAIENFSEWVAEFGWITPKTKQKRWIRAQDFPQTVNGEQCWLGVMIDITPLKDANHQLLAANQVLQSHLENSPVAQIEWDAEMRVKSWSAQATQIFGWDDDEVRGRNPWEFAFIHLDDLVRVTEVCKVLTSAKEPRNVVFNRNYDRSGRVIDCEWHNSVLHDDEGKLKGILSLVLDVTEHRRVSAARLRDREELHRIMEMAGVLGWSASPVDWTVQYSQDSKEFFGNSARETSRDCPEILLPVHPEFRTRVLSELEDGVRSGRSVSIDFRGTQTDDGSEHWYTILGKLGQDETNAPRLFGITQNITERRLAEKRRETLEAALRQGKEREARGLIVGGIAHEFNNLNTIIAGHISLAQRVRLPEQLAQALREAESATDRAINLCKQLSQCVGTMGFSPKSVNVSRMLALAIAQLPSHYRTRVRITEVPEHLHLMGDQTQLQDMFVNLLTQSLADPSTLSNSVSVEVDSLDREAIRSAGHWDNFAMSGIRFRLERFP